MAAKLVAALPQGEDWLFELKFDGYRALILKDGDSVEIRSRKGCPHCGERHFWSIADARLEDFQSAG